MAAIAVGLGWLGYTMGLWGYCLVKGYNISPRDLVSPNWPPGGTTLSSSMSSGTGGESTSNTSAGSAVGSQTGDAIRQITGG